MATASSHILLDALSLLLGIWVIFCSIFAISASDVLAHSLILGSVQHLYASYIYILFLPAPPPFSS
jgi:uncharacterized MnhB-related membrane protein